MRAAIDIGGTFTDVLLYNENNGELWSAKVPSNREQPASSFMDALLRVLRDSNMEIKQLTELVHGTTIATNALLEGKIAKVGLLVTEGFQDILEIGRQQRPHLYDLMVDRRPPLVPRNLVKEVRERIDADGNIVIPLDENDVRAKIEMLNKASVESLAVTLLFSFFNPEHETRVGSLARKLAPNKFIFLSNQISPEFREFERASTTVVAAAIAPLVVSYLQAVEQNLKNHGWHEGWLAIMHSGGGTVWPKEAIRRPHTLIESGPAAGLIASGHLAKILGVERCIGFDMGGTTAKAGLILNGEIQYAAEYEVGAELHHGGRVKGSGYPLRFPMVDVAECGAGAGSIAWIDSGGHLKVGPSSAGANPGPACYGKGGKEPTVTDAHLVLGHLSPDYFLGGEMQLEPKLAENAINKYIAEPMDITLEKAAQGIITIANANMLRVLRLVSVARGHDPRDFTLMAYGGAGPLHAIALAEEMFIGQVIIPQLSGLFSALGLLYADMSTDFVETVMLTLTPENLDSLNAVLANLNEKAEKFFERAEVPSKARLSRVSADLRYLRQNYELKVPLEASQISSCDLSFIRTRFNKYHENTYGYKSLDEPIQVVNLRLFALRRLIKPKPHRIGSSIDPVDIALHKTQIVWFSDGPQRCDVYRRDKLQKGHHIEGPAIIQEKEATTVVEVGWHVQVDEFGNLIMKRHP